MPWNPVLVLPNLDLRDAVGCDHAAIVPVTDERAEELRADHPRLNTFLSKFRTQFGAEAWPALFLLSADAPQSYRTAEAVTGLRDVLSVSVVPYARASRLYHDRPNELVFSNAFQFYPWMLDAEYEDLFLINPAQMHAHLLDEFHGQTFPEQPQSTVNSNNIDRPLASLLLDRWVERFSEGVIEWRDKALFRSLAMANEAARIPALTAATFYDVGRSLALWVSAYEILAHPEGADQANFRRVSALLENVHWLLEPLSVSEHLINGNPPQNRILAVWINRKIYDLRNDYLHGNEVDPADLELNGKTIIDFAACIFRFALAGFLDLRFDEPEPNPADEAAVRQHMGRRLRFNTRQELFERALFRAV